MNAPVPNKGTYEQVWAALAANTQEEIIVDCPVSHMETLIQAVKKVKSMHNAARKKLNDPNLPHWGRLQVKKDTVNRKVHFSLSYSLGDLL